MSKGPPNKDAGISGRSSFSHLIRELGLSPQSTNGRKPIQDEALVFDIARRMLTKPVPASLSKAIEEVLSPFVTIKRGPKRDWILQWQGGTFQYKSVEERLRARYLANPEGWHRRVHELEQLQERAAIRTRDMMRKGLDLQPGRSSLSIEQIDRLRRAKSTEWAQDIESRAEAVGQAIRESSSPTPTARKVGK